MRNGVNTDHWEIYLLQELIFYSKKNLFHAENVLFD